MLQLIILVLLVLVVGLLALTPTAVLAIAAVKYRRAAGDNSGWVVLVATVIVALLAILAFAPVLLASTLSAEALVEAALILGLVEPTLTWIALLLLGIGIWMQSATIRRIRDSRGGGAE